MTIADPFAAVAELIVAWHKASQIQNWFKLIFGCVFSFWITFNITAGGCLIGKVPVPIAVGYGMVSGAALAFVSYNRASSKLTAGVTVAVPLDTNSDQIDTKGQPPLIIGK